MSKGWIKLHRQIQDCYLWEDRPFNQGAAWVGMLLTANHKDAKIIFDKKPLLVQAGSFITSSRKLSDKWGWSRGRVDRFLKTLQEEQMILLDVNTKRTLITIVNYSKFQISQTTDDTTDSTTNEPQVVPQIKPLTDTNKNDKELKNVKNEKNEKKIYYPNDSALNEAFEEYISMRKKIKKPLTSDHAIDLAMRKLENLSFGDNDLAIEILNQSILNSWQGLFEIKGRNNNKIDWDKV